MRPIFIVGADNDVIQFIIESRSEPGHFHELTFFRREAYAVCPCDGAKYHKHCRKWIVGTNHIGCYHLQCLRSYMRPFLEANGLEV